MRKRFEAKNSETFFAFLWPRLLRRSFSRPEFQCPHQRSKARVRTKRIEARINLNVTNIRKCTALITLFKPLDRLVVMPKSRIDESKAERRNVAMLGSFL